MKSTSDKSMLDGTRGMGLFAMCLFISLLSGPPRFRIRDAEASLYGEIDAVVVLQLAVWTLAGLWVAWQFLQSHTKVRLQRPEKLGLVLVALLTLAVFRSPSPALTVFKVLQLAVMILFAALFVQLYGIRKTLKVLLAGNTILCIAIVVAAFFAPEMVFVTDYWQSYQRLQGNNIAQTASVSALAFILLFTVPPRVSKVKYLVLLGLFITLLALSRGRTGLLCVLAFLAIAFIARPHSPAVRRIAWLAAVAIPAALVIGGGQLISWALRDDPSSVWDLSDRIGLWTHLWSVTVDQAPWTGLGYYAASRVYGPEYNPGLGTAHSVFMEILSGGGILSLAIFLVLLAVVSLDMTKLYREHSKISFGIVSLFIACLMLLFVGEDISYGPVGLTFWCLTAMGAALVKVRGQRLEPASPRWVSASRRTVLEHGLPS